MHTAVENSRTASYDWVEYFYQNAPEPRLPWSNTMRLSGAEKLAVIHSIQQFQLREGANNGARMLERAKQFSRATADLGMIAALRLFLREEQRHSQMLARFLQLESVPCLRKPPVYSTFRWLRGLGGLEFCLKVLVTAEVLARPFYAALRDATGSPLLREICQRILEEEAAHLRFQAFVLRRFQGQHWRWTGVLVRQCHAGLLAVTALLVWMEHSSVFQAAGRTFGAFWNEVWREFALLYRVSCPP